MSKMGKTEWHITAMRSLNGGLWYGYALDVSKKTQQEIDGLLAFYHNQGVPDMHLHYVKNKLQCKELGDKVIQVVGGNQSVSVRAFEKLLQNTFNTSLPENRFDSLLDVQRQTHWIPTKWNQHGTIVQGVRLSVRDVSKQKKQEIIDFLNVADIHFIEKTVSHATDTLIAGEKAIAVKDPESLQRLQRIWDIAKWNRQKSDTDIDYDIAKVEDVYRNSLEQLQQISAATAMKGRQ